MNETGADTEAAKAEPTPSDLRLSCGIERHEGADVAASRSEQATGARCDLPPKPAVRQRTTRQATGGDQSRQDLHENEETRSKSLNSTRDELKRELQAELGRKLSLARSRLDESEQLERQLSNSYLQQQQQQQQELKQKDFLSKLSATQAEPRLSSSMEQVTGDDKSDGIVDQTKAQPDRPYPRKVFFIIANEFCERFSYYGLRAVLVLYLTGVLNFTESNSTITFHLFAMLCYVTSILGAILADSIIGKFKTIVYLSLVYLAGELVLLLSSVFWHHGQLSIWSTFAGLALIGLGTGGIKPCVGALGGDQFLAHEEKRRQSFFSLYYAAINLGSLITVLVTPLLRTKFHCVGRQDCFPYAFGLPCALMLLSIVVFLVAKNQYYLAPLPKENVIVSFCNCIWIACKRRLLNRRPKFVLHDNLASGEHPVSQVSSGATSEASCASLDEETFAQSSSTHLAPGPGATGSTNGPHQLDEHSKRRSHWLYLAADRYDSKSIEAFRSVLALLLLFIPTLVYWCLFDQQGSLWTLQATRMDGRILADRFVVQPDQMGVANPLILLAVIPVFQLFIYPAFARCNLLKKPLQRMTVGGFVASLAFLSSALIEMRIQQFLPPNEPSLGSANLILVNGLRECSLSNPTISHIFAPDIPAGGAGAMTGASNQTTLASSLGQQQQQRQQQSTNERSTIIVESLEALAVQSLDVDSTNSSSLMNYQLKMRLTDSVEQIKSNRSFGCPIADGATEHKFNLAPLPDQVTRLLYLELGNGKLTYKMFNESLELPASSRARVRLLYEFFGSSSQADRRQFYLSARKSAPIGLNATNESHQQQQSKPETKWTFTNHTRDGQVILSNHIDVELPTTGAWFSLESSDSKLIWSGAASSAGILLEPGTRNLLIVHQIDANHVLLKHQLLQDNRYRISMLYQLIPYTLISMSEVMFSITGLEFSYSMAPDSMKSVLMAIWSLTVALGNLLTVFIESLHLFSEVANEFMFYSGLMAVDMCIFAIMGYNFRPNKYHSSS